SGTASGGGYELAEACDEIVLAEDGSSAVSLPEAPLLAVLPGTGGLTRLVDKRKVRKDLADVFSTLAEGARGKRAVEWGLVDEAPPKAKFDDAVNRRTDAMVTRSKRKAFAPVKLPPIGAETKYVDLHADDAHRTATLTVKAPDGTGDATPEAWGIRAFRELDR